MHVLSRPISQPILFCPFLSQSILFCPFLSQPILFCPFLSQPILFCPFLSQPFLFRLILSQPVLFLRPMLSWPVLFNPILPRPILFRPITILDYPIQSYTIRSLSYSVLSYSMLFWLSHTAVNVHTRQDQWLLSMFYYDGSIQAGWGSSPGFNYKIYRATVTNLGLTALMHIIQIKSRDNEIF